MTVSDWGPDSPADDAPDLGGPWEGRFVGDPGTVRPISAAPDEHFPPAEVDGYRLASANEATRVATYRAAADAEGLVPVNASAAGATNTPNPDPSAIPSGNDGSGQLSPEPGEVDWMAAYVRAAINEWRMHFDPTADYGEAMDHYISAALVRHGYRLVSDDDATVERVAQALVKADGHTVDEVVAEGEWDVYPVLAHAAVWALREAPSATSKTPQRQLCGQCDAEVEAEVAEERALREAGTEWVPGGTWTARSGCRRRSGCASTPARR